MAKIYMLYWFDTEDYVTPETDDALLRLAQILTKNGIRGTFKLVGEKLRMLERRGRNDVIDALRCHDIGFHCDTHSQTPMVPQYLEGMEMEDGAEEFIWREGRGLADIRRVFGHEASCYGQPGGTWAPQPHLSMRKMGMPVYLGEGSYVGIDSQQPYWLMGILSISRLGMEHEAAMDLSKNDLEGAKQHFLEIKKNAGDTPTLVNIAWHECEFVCPEFWDAVNFTRGEWRAPAQRVPAPMYSPAEVESRLHNFDLQARWLAEQPDIEFITANEAAMLFPDRTVGRMFNKEELQMIAKQLGEKLHWVEVAGTTISAAEALCLLCETAVGEGAVNKPIRNQFHLVLGPNTFVTLPATQKLSVGWNDLKPGAQQVLDAALCGGRLPAVVAVKGQDLALTDFASALARTATSTLAGKPGAVEVQAEPMATDRYAHFAPGAVGWIPFPEGLVIDKQIAITKAQMWTLKPAQFWCA
jgi:hypothetical protein